MPDVVNTLRLRSPAADAPANALAMTADGKLIYGKECPALYLRYNVEGQRYAPSCTMFGQYRFCPIPDENGMYGDFFLSNGELFRDTSKPVVLLRPYKDSRTAYDGFYICPPDGASVPGVKYEYDFQNNTITNKTVSDVVGTVLSARSGNNVVRRGFSVWFYQKTRCEHFNNKTTHISLIPNLDDFLSAFSFNGSQHLLLEPTVPSPPSVLGARFDGDIHHTGFIYKDQQDFLFTRGMLLRVNLSLNQQIYADDIDLSFSAPGIFPADSHTSGGGTTHSIVYMPHAYDVVSAIYFDVANTLHDDMISGWRCDPGEITASADFEGFLPTAKTYADGHMESDGYNHESFATKKLEGFCTSVTWGKVPDIISCKYPIGQYWLSKKNPGTPA